MKFGWETEKERLLRFMRISPKRKLEWLEEMRQFAVHHLPKKTREIHLKLRAKRS